MHQKATDLYEGLARLVCLFIIPGYKWWFEHRMASPATINVQFTFNHLPFFDCDGLYVG